MEQLKVTAKNKHIPVDIRLKAANSSGQSLDEPDNPQHRQYRRCAFCRNRKTRNCRYICIEHSKQTCQDSIGNTLFNFGRTAVCITFSFFRYSIFCYTL